MAIYYQDEFVTLYHGDSREVLAREDIQADVLITDPPYAVKKNGEMLGFVSPNWHKKETHSRGYADHCPEAFANLLGPVFDLAYDLLPDGGLAVSFGGNRTLHQMNSFMEDSGFQILDLLVFGYNSGVAKSPTTLAPRHEIATLARKPGKVKHINPDWTLTNRNDLGKPRGKQKHLTTKPMSWMEWLVNLTAFPGEVILDPFAGSGTTLVAAKKLGFTAVGVEQDEGYCEIAAERIQDDK